MSQMSKPWERQAERAELRKNAIAAAGAGILPSGLLTSRQSAKVQRPSAAFATLPTETAGAVMGVGESQAAEGPFIGPPGYPVANPNELAREADAARRER